MSNNKIQSTPKPDYAAAGDLLRVVCAFFVAWYHIWQQSWLHPAIKVLGVRIDFMPAVRPGYMFVDLMLVLSGFLTYLPYACGKARSPRAFYLRRAQRILPSYWFCLIVMMIFALSAPHDTARLVKDLLLHLGFMHNTTILSYNATQLNVVLWTLAVEVQFYLILPALAPVFKKRPLVTYIAMTALGLCSMYFVTLPMADTTLYVNRLPNMLVVYANGMLAAQLYAKLTKKRWQSRRAIIAMAGTLTALAAVYAIVRILKLQMRATDFEAIRKGQLKWRWAFSACGAAFLAGGSLSFKPIRLLMSNRVTRFLAGVSFNFYIWHQWLAVKLKEWHIPAYLSESNPNMAGEMPWQRNYTLLCFALAFLLATLVTYLIEKPCADFIRKLETRRDA